MDAQEARIIEQATTSVLEAGLRTGDIKQAGDDIVTTSQMGDAIKAEVEKLCAAAK